MKSNFHHLRRPNKKISSIDLLPIIVEDISSFNSKLINSVISSDDKYFSICANLLFSILKEPLSNPLDNRKLAHIFHKLGELYSEPEFYAQAAIRSYRCSIVMASLYPTTSEEEYEIFKQYVDKADFLYSAKGLVNPYTEKFKKMHDFRKFGAINVIYETYQDAKKLISKKKYSDGYEYLKKIADDCILNNILNDIFIHFVYSEVKKLEGNIDPSKYVDLLNHKFFSGMI